MAKAADHETRLGQERGVRMGRVYYGRYGSYEQCVDDGLFREVREVRLIGAGACIRVGESAKTKQQIEARGMPIDRG